MSVLFVVCLLTFVHYAAAQVRAPILPLYAAEHGATPTAVGLVIGAHMLVAAVGSIPLGRAADVWGRRPLLLGGMAVGVVTSALLPVIEAPWALTLVFGAAGLGVAAFTPSALSIVGDAAAPGRAGHAFAWYSTAHYSAIGIGPLLGGFIAEWWGYRAAFVASAAGIAAALVVGWMLPIRGQRPAAAPRLTPAAIRGNAGVWGGWLVSLSGLLIQGTVFTFFPLLAQERGLAPGKIGLALGVLGLANTVARYPAGWLIDRTHRSRPFAIAGILVASALTVALPRVTDYGVLLALGALFGVVSGLAYVAIGVVLAAASTPATRGLVMGGYSTSLYLGLALGSFALGPVVTRAGYAVGFATAGALGVVGTLIAAGLWARRAAAGVETATAGGRPAAAPEGARRAP